MPILRRNNYIREALPTSRWYTPGTTITFCVPSADTDDGSDEDKDSNMASSRQNLMSDESNSRLSDGQFSDDRTNDYKTGFELQDNKPRSKIDGDKQEISSKTDDSEVTAEELEEHEKLEWWRNGSALSGFCRTCKGEEYGEDGTQTGVPYAAPK